MMGLCVAVLLDLVASNVRITRMLSERNGQLVLAINKTEEACLGLLGNDSEFVNDKKTWSGKIKKGLRWKVVEQPVKDDNKIFLYNVNIAGINLQGVRIQK